MSRNLTRLRVKQHHIGLLFNPHALWVGVHYSGYTRRFCVNIAPCLTVWWALPGGKQP